MSHHPSTAALLLALAAAAPAAHAKVRVVEAVLAESGPLVRAANGEVHGVARAGRRARLFGRVPRSCSQLVADGAGAWCVEPARRPGRSLLLHRVDAERARRSVHAFPTDPGEPLPGPPVALAGQCLHLAGGWALTLGEEKLLVRAESPSPAAPPPEPQALPESPPGYRPLGVHEGRAWHVAGRGPWALVAQELESGAVERYRVRGPAARRWRAAGAWAANAVVYGPVLLVAGAVAVASSPVTLPLSLANAKPGAAVERVEPPASAETKAPEDDAPPGERDE